MFSTRIIVSRIIRSGRGAPLARSFANSAVVELNDSLEAVQNFQKSNPKAILYYTATWCGPCRTIKPVYTELAEKFDGKIGFGLVDIDENMDASYEAKIKSVPTFMSYMDGKLANTFSGADPSQLQAMATELDQK